MSRSCVQTTCEAKGQATESVICPTCEHTTLPFVDTHDIDGIRRADVSTRVFEMSSHDEDELPTENDVVVFETGAAWYSGSRRKRATRIAIRFAILCLTVALCIANAVAGRLPLLMCLGAILALQNIAILIRIRRLNGPVTEDPDVQYRIATMLKDLCSKAGWALPLVSIRRTPHIAGVLITRSQVSLVISPELIEAADDDAMRSILSHEVVHLSVGDVGTYRRRSRFFFVAAYELGVAGLIFLGHSHEIAWTLWLAFTAPGLMVVALLMGFTFRSHETRADVLGTEATGDPEAMIRGLQLVYQFAQRDRDVVFGRPPLRWLLFTYLIPGTTHPPLAQRIAGLREMSMTGSQAPQTP